MYNPNQNIVVPSTGNPPELATDFALSIETRKGYKSAQGSIILWSMETYSKIQLQ